MAGTDKSKQPATGGGPAVVLVNPQLGQNIGTAARAMWNCGLTDLRLVAPREGWPNDWAVKAASGADLVIETTGSISVLAQALDLARIGGRVLPFAIYTAKEAPLPFYQFYFKELNIINARAAKGEDFPASVDLVRNGDVKLDPLITHVVPLDDMGRALDMLESSDEKTMKIILEH